MVAWKRKAKIPKWGICTVKSAADRECQGFSKRYGGYPAPRSHGFVNLFQGDKLLGWCGVNFARKRLI